MFVSFRTSVMLGTLALFPVHVAAQDNSSADQNTQPDKATALAVAALDTMTVTGTARKVRPFNAPADIDVVEGREKHKHQTASLGASLDALPGISNIGTGSQTGKPVIRGLSGNRVRVMQNGIGMYHQQFGVRHAPNIEPFLAERIEVVRGASSILYGSDAIGGAVNVISTPVPFAAPGQTELGGEVTGGYSTNNNERMGGLRLNAANDQFGFTGAFLGRDGGNINTPNVSTFPESGRAGAPNFSGDLDHTDYEQRNGELAFGWLAPFGTVTARYKHWEDDHNYLLPPPINLPNGIGIGQRLENDLVQVEAMIDLSPGWHLEPSFTWSNNKRQSNPGPPPAADRPNGSTREYLPEDIVIDLERDSYTGRLELVHENINNWLSGRWGVEVVREEQVSRGSVALSPGGEIDNYSLFGFEELDFGALVVNAGLRFDRREQKADASETFDQSVIPAARSLSEQSYSVVTGSIGASYQMTDNLVAAANVGRGFRAPDLFELYVNGVHGGVAAVQRGDASLDEETSLNTDLSLRWKSERLQAKMTVYRNKVSDYIFFGDTGMTNAGGLPILQAAQADATLYGTDLSAHYQFNDVFAVHGGYEMVRGDFDRGGDDLPLLPADELRAGFTVTPASTGVLNNPYMTLEVVHKMDKDAAGRLEPFSQFDNTPFGTASTDDYTLVNVYAGFDLPYQASGSAGRVNLRVNNLFDEDYRDFLDTYKGYALSPGRNVTVQMTLPF
jgi:iron complex outermembrane receptor protein/hemoglobin/transferrin/lactoferrin receptor protein